MFIRNLTSVLTDGGINPDIHPILEDNQLPPTTVNLLRKQRNAIESSYRKADYLEDVM